MQMSEQESLYKFGQFITEKLRDNQIQFAEDVLAGKYKSQRLIELHQQLLSLDDSQRAIALSFVRRVIDVGIHDFLFSLVERSDVQNDISVLVDGEDVVKLSDGLHGEAYSEDGWYAKFSKYSES
jgi:hypothetical protein